MQILKAPLFVTLFVTLCRTLCRTLCLSYSTNMRANRVPSDALDRNSGRLCLPVTHSITDPPPPAPPPQKQITSHSCKFKGSLSRRSAESISETTRTPDRESFFVIPLRPRDPSQKVNHYSVVLCINCNCSVTFHSRGPIRSMSVGFASIFTLRRRVFDLRSEFFTLQTRSIYRASQSDFWFQRLC